MLRRLGDIWTRWGRRSGNGRNRQLAGDESAKCNDMSHPRGPASSSLQGFERSSKLQLPLELLELSDTVSIITPPSCN